MVMSPVYKAAFFALFGLWAAGAAPVAAREHYGAQLYTVRAAMEGDFEGTLRRVADIGYDEVEFAGLFGRDPATIRSLIKKLGLKATSSHVDWQRLRDDPDGLIKETKALGAPYLVLAWLSPEQRQTLNQWRWWVSHLNKVGKMARKQGLRVVYHAHDFEYRPIDGVRPIDLLEQGLDPKFARFEMDIYWTVKGGGDPVALLRKYPGRFPLAHIKDMSRADTAMADVGDGRIDFAEIFKAAGPGDFKHMFVERDDGADPFASLTRSLTYLKSIERKR
jgi:sugar phosphate isomerase/epimerase